MKGVSTTVVLLFMCLMVTGQSRINIHITSGAVYVIELADVDSLIYSTTTEPYLLTLYQESQIVLQLYLSDVDSTTYGEGGPAGTPNVYTIPPSGVSDTCAQVGGGGFPSNGNEAGMTHGICWSDQPLPTIDDNMLEIGVGQAFFQGLITGLSNNSTYYARTFTTNPAGTSYGNQVMFHTNAPDLITVGPGSGTTDLDGNVYSSVVMGNGQEWMTENLRATFYANGDPIENILDDQAWSQASVGAWSYYDNEIANGGLYGAIYNGYAVSDPRNVCPADWHVPTYQDMLALMDYLGGSILAGPKLKDPADWWNDNTSTNESGFSAAPTGFRGSLGDFDLLGDRGMWWTSTNLQADLSVWRLGLNSSQSEATIVPVSINNGNSVRCIKD